MRIVVLLMILLLVAPATGMAQKRKKARPKPKPKRTAVVKPAEPEEEKPHVISTPAPFNVNVARRMSAEDVKARMELGEAITVVDTRSRFTGPMARGAVHLTDDALATLGRNLPKETMIIVYCTCHNEHTSVRTVLKLQTMGFKNAFALTEGLTAWQRVGLPIQYQASP